MAGCCRRAKLTSTMRFTMVSQATLRRGNGAHTQPAHPLGVPPVPTFWVSRMLNQSVELTGEANMAATSS
jgi:hypothetical protein